jgi:hypothetical protein
MEGMEKKRRKVQNPRAANCFLRVVAGPTPDLCSGHTSAEEKWVMAVHLIAASRAVKSYEISCLKGEQTHRVELIQNAWHCRGSRCGSFAASGNGS